MDWLSSSMGMETIMPGTPPRAHSLADSSLFRMLHLTETMRRIEDELRSGGDAAQREELERRLRHPSCIEEACVYGNFAAVVYLWAQGRVHIPTHRSIYEGNDASPLMWAAFRSRLDMVRFLVDQGADVNAVNMLGHSVLQWAIYGGSCSVVRFLLDAGARPDSCDRQGHDAAFTAVQCDRFALLCMLTESPPPPMARNELESNCTAVQQAESDVHVVAQHTRETPTTTTTATATRTTMKRFALDANKRDVEGHSLLHWAAYINSPAMCAYLAEVWHYDVHAADFSGRTALIWAAREGYAETVELLLHMGAHVGHKDRSGLTALQYARTRHHVETAHLLMRWENGRPDEDVDISSPPPSSSQWKQRNMYKKSDGVACDSHPSSRRVAMLSALRCRMIAYMWQSCCGRGNGTHDSRNRAHLTRAGRTVRDRRRCGTLRMLADHILFRLMALYGMLWLALSYLVTRVLPPWAGGTVMWLFLAMKNVLWSHLVGKPERGGSSNNNKNNSAASSASESGSHRADAAALYKPDVWALYESTATSVMSLWRGTAVYRFRDPVYLVLLVLIPLMQLYAWDALGLTPILMRGGAGSSSGNATSHTEQPYLISPSWVPQSALERDVFYYQASNPMTSIITTRKIMRDLIRSRSEREIPPSHVYFGGAMLSTLIPRFSDPAVMIPYTLWGLLVMGWVMVVCCKCAESLHFVTPSHRHNRQPSCVRPGDKVAALEHVSCSSRSNSNSGNDSPTHLMCVDDGSHRRARYGDDVGGAVQRQSPLWRILGARRYAWLHPRCFAVERHMQIPLRSFYCVERDDFVHTYDGYSATLDCAIGQSNRLCYVLGIACLTLFELTLLAWAATQLTQALRCNAGTTAVRVFGTAAAVAAGDNGGAGASAALPNTPTQQVQLMKSAVQPWYAALLHGMRSRGHLLKHIHYDPKLTTESYIVVRFSLTRWLCTLINILLHGLPCRMNAYSTWLTLNFAQNTHGGFALRMMFMFYYYVWPTTSNVYGMWVLQVSLLAGLAGLCVLMREGVAIWRGVTCMEYDNPVAPGEDGALVSIFPAQPHTATVVSSLGRENDNATSMLCAGEEQRCDDYDEDENKDEAVGGGSGGVGAYQSHGCRPDGAGNTRAGTTRKAGRQSRESRMSIFANTSYGLLNVLSFLTLIDGRRWKGAMSVSAHNNPVKRELLES